ncbi:RelA/SpoT domain-containing protein [Polaromonas sp.]|uniref:RelA/SpoT domain-containing protein n=1 Tax=Polaromonas sp. TaxID=1869339 RepID=UPI0018274AC1|nr:RelA/SpoT domain-containing protein [Polaromonas sp.]NMM05178.1 RelA/SpoT domain-containing protein [Polaromonas sp.]
MATAKQKRIAKLVDLYQTNLHLFKLFQEGVSNALRFDPALNSDPHPIIHSIKTRLKDPSHLAEKIARKESDSKEITEGSLFTDITDLAGVRVLHLHQAQAAKIHEFIISRVTDKEWYLVEKPIAYSWDPDATQFFQGLGLKVKIKPSHYTSIHYVVRPKKGAQASCEIQVRTLFEEIWGEIDHTVNYPKPATNIATTEQLRVLSKLVSAGSRLADSVFKLHTP